MQLSYFARAKSPLSVPTDRAGAPDSPASFILANLRLAPTSTTEEVRSVACASDRSLAVSVCIPACASVSS
jgi:hypothetical protein